MEYIAVEDTGRYGVADLRLPELMLFEKYLDMLDFNIKSMLDNTKWSLLSHLLYDKTKFMQAEARNLRALYVNEIKFPI